jgi:hypothetical protein
VEALEKIWNKVKTRKEIKEIGRNMEIADKEGK